MKNLAYLLLLSFLSIALWGCPYKSSVPLGEPTEYISKQVLGKWVPKSMENKENPDYYVIEMRDTFNYDVEHFQYNDEEEGYASKTYVCWTTRVNDILFMNVQQSAQREVTLYRLDVMGDDLMVLYEVTNNIDERFEDSATMLEFFKKHMKLSFFYNGDEVELIKTP